MSSNSHRAPEASGPGAAPPEPESAPASGTLPSGGSAATPQSGVEPAADALLPPPPSSSGDPPPSSGSLASSRQALARVALRHRTSIRPRPGPEKPRHGLLLVDTDRLGRAALARALMRAEWDVSPVDHVDDLVESLRASDRVRAALIDVRHPRAATMFAAIASVRPELLVIVRGPDAAAARAQLAAAGLVNADVRPREAPVEDLIEALRPGLPPPPA